MHGVLSRLAPGYEIDGTYIPMCIALGYIVIDHEGGEPAAMVQARSTSAQFFFLDIQKGRSLAFIACGLLLPERAKMDHSKKIYSEAEKIWVYIEIDLEGKGLLQYRKLEAHSHGISTYKTPKLWFYCWRSFIAERGKMNFFINSFPVPGALRGSTVGHV